MTKTQKGNPLVSVVILSYNRKDDVRETLQMLKQQKYEPIEIILVDNCSADSTASMVKEEFPEVILIETSENIGVSAYNIGFKKADGQFIVILDDDSYPGAEAIERMVKRFQEDQRLGIIAFNVRDHKEYEKTSEAISNDGSNINHNYLMSFNGAGAGVRKEIIGNIGGYPDEFFLYVNENDLALRVLDAGYKIEAFSDIRAYHKTSQVNRPSKRAPFYYTRNLFWLIWKHYPADMMWKTTITLVFYVFYYSLEQKTFIYLKAMADAAFNIGKIKNKRNPVRRDIANKFRLHLKTPFSMYI
ncbi:glycosyltransferase [Candidatus Magnetoovum chiemensis]|nr:glycosyltransferase [Candidatus Magnetoovum chiemensis]